MTADPRRERVLWTLYSGERRATAIESPAQGGNELRVLIGGQLVLTREFHSMSEPSLSNVAEDYRALLVSSGWTVSP